MAAATFVVLFGVQAIAAAPEVTEISEPAEGAAPLHPADVHMVAEFDGEADHFCTSWEIRMIGPGEPVWQAPCAKGVEKVHIHLGDGNFVNSHAGLSALQFETAYLLRVRSRDAGEDEAEWGEWAERGFTTREPGPEGSKALTWQARQGFVVEKFAEGLQLPVNVAMVPDPGPHAGDPLMYVAELYGHVKVIARDGTVRDYAEALYPPGLHPYGLLNFEPTGNFPGSGEIGLTGLVVEPESGDLFVSLVYEDTASVLDPKPHYPKVVRLHSDERGLEAVAESPVLDMEGTVQGASHQVSNLTISPQGHLFVHNGDGGDGADEAPDPGSYLGKVLRMTLDGKPVEDNPFYDAGNGIGAEDYVYAKGFRNPFGGAWRLSDGTHWEVENGPAVDRLAKVIAGEDYGWPTDEGMQAHAAYNWPHSHAPVNIEFVEPQRFGGSGFPATSMGHAFVTESGSTYASGPQANGKRIVEFDIDAAGQVKSGPATLVEYGGIGKATAVGLAAGPDGLYFTDLYKDLDATSPIERGAGVLRVRYCGAACTSSPPTGQPPSAVEPVGPMPPHITGFRLRKDRLLLGPRRPGADGRKGVPFLYWLSEPARVTIGLFALKGARHRALGAIVAPGSVGLNRRPFSGYLHGRRLAPGRYLAQIQADGAGGSASQSAGFSVVERLSRRRRRG